MFGHQTIRSFGARLGMQTGLIVAILVGLSFTVGVPEAECKLIQKEDQPPVKLVKKLADSPELISFDYLKVALGQPDRVSILPSGTTRQAQWFEPGTNRLRYRFEQEFGPLVPTGSVQNKFDAFLKEPEKIDMLGLSTRPKSKDASSTTHFNERGHPALVHKMSPYMTLEACHPKGDRMVNEINLSYLGPALPPVSAKEIDEALQLRITEAAKVAALGHNAQAVFLLSAYLVERPNDGDARMKLAQAYRGCGCLNQAIDQYRILATTAPSDSRFREAALQELEVMKSGSAASKHGGAASSKVRRTKSGTLSKKARTPGNASGTPAQTAHSNNPDDDPFKTDGLDWKSAPRSRSLAATERAVEPGF
jgi:hypothetical protein